jgi:hypothetical protein
MLAHRSWTWLPVRAEEGTPAERDYLELLTHSTLSLIIIEPVLLLITRHHLTAWESVTAACFGTHSCPSIWRSHLRRTLTAHLSPANICTRPSKSHAPVIIHDSMSALKDSNFSDLSGSSEPENTCTQNAVSNYEQDTGTMSELANDMALGMKIGTSGSGQKSAAGTEEGAHEARLLKCSSRSPLTDFTHRVTR